MHTPRVPRLAAPVLLLTCALAARAHDPIDRIVVTGTRQARSAASSQDIRAFDFELRPHSSMQEILNNVPGLIVRQHQGGGKATQYLIRGFDADHGTDFYVTVDDVPANMRTHGHGQGYADANFVIPETLERLELHKGPYFVEYGDFATAGALNMVTRDAFEEDFVLAEGGSFDRQRYVVGLSPTLGEVQTLFAGQAAWSNGPFDHEENLAKYNGFAKATWEPTSATRVALSGSLYAADWDASGQIPQREVSAGRLGRFGAIDPTEGGRTDREDVNLVVGHEPSAHDEWKVRLWASRYRLRLFSNFTFFQETGRRFFERPAGGIVDTGGIGPTDPSPFGTPALPGDGIEQLDSRWLWGGSAVYRRDWHLGGRDLTTRLGLETRHDHVDVELWRQVRRDRFFAVTKNRVRERSIAGFLGSEVWLASWLRLEGGLRGDVFLFDVDDRLPRQRPDPDFRSFPIRGNTSDGIVSPKATAVVMPRDDLEVYLDFGTGFHSNDARVVVANGVDPLVRAVGAEVGARTRLRERLHLAAALWILDLDSELVFVGDAGTREPSGETRRWGVDFEARWEILDWLFADWDFNWADPRFKNGDAVPIAPTLFMNGGLSAELRNGFSAAARVRFLDDRPAVEDRSVSASGYLVVDLFAKYRWRNVELGLDLLNAGDVDWQEAVFADTSCTAREVRRGRCPSRVDRHFTPGDPFGVRGRVVAYF